MGGGGKRTVASGSKQHTQAAMMKWSAASRRRLAMRRATSLKMMKTVGTTEKMMEQIKRASCPVLTSGSLIMVSVGWFGVPPQSFQSVGWPRFFCAAASCLSFFSSLFPFSSSAIALDASGSRQAEGFGDPVREKPGLRSGIHGDWTGPTSSHKLTAKEKEREKRPWAILL